jgi:hypothetical protein
METQTQFASLKDKIRAEKAARAARYAEFAALYQRAHDAGMAAGNAVKPIPMSVRSGSVIVDVVADGVCGFAWVIVHPGTCSFARWLTKAKDASKAYHGGVYACWVREFNQSMTRKEAYARAFANVLRAAGITAYAESRMD